KLSRSSNPSIPLRFVLYCKTKEGGGAQGGQGGSELTSITFLAKMAQAEEYYQAAKLGMQNFFENISSARINFGLVYQQLKMIVESEVKSRKCFEELMVMQPHNTAVLRNYARLLLDIYNDEDTAEMILQRAEMIEEESTQSSTNIEAKVGQDPASGPPASLTPFSSNLMGLFKGNQSDQGMSNENSQQQKSAQQMSISGASRKSVTKKKKKKKKKDSGSGDAVITELQGGGGGTGDDNTLMKRMIIILILLSHFLAIAS
ncbi:MAG: hypothetical protein EZS28_053518, partial [Streblomastix strix]